MSDPEDDDFPIIKWHSYPCRVVDGRGFKKDVEYEMADPDTFPALELRNGMLLLIIEVPNEPDAHPFTVEVELKDVFHREVSMGGFDDEQSAASFKASLIRGLHKLIEYVEQQPLVFEAEKGVSP